MILHLLPLFPFQVHLNHTWFRGVQRAVLCGNDPATDQNVEHRRAWLSEFQTSMRSLEIATLTQELPDELAERMLDADSDLNFSDSEPYLKSVRCNPLMSVPCQPQPKRFTIRDLLIVTGAICLSLGFIRFATFHQYLPFHSKPTLGLSLFVIGVFMLGASIGRLAGRLKYGTSDEAQYWFWIGGAIALMLCCILTFLLVPVYQAS